MCCCGQCGKVWCRLGSRWFRLRSLHVFTLLKGQNTPVANAVCQIKSKGCFVFFAQLGGFSIILIFCCMWIFFDLWKVQMIDLKFYKTNPTDKFRTPRHTESKVTATTSAHFEVRTSAQFEWNIGVKAVLFQMIYFEFSVCSVHLHIEQKWKIKNIHACAVQLTQPRPAWLTQNRLD